jgi:hypothetical protein
LDYDGNTVAYTASMQAFDILYVSIRFTEGGNFASADIKDFYLGTPLVDKPSKPVAEYMRIAPSTSLSASKPCTTFKSLRTTASYTWRLLSLSTASPRVDVKHKTAW